MKKVVFLIWFTCISNFCFSQVKSEYSIFLLLNSERKEMLIDSIMINNKLELKIYTVTKEVPKEKENYILSIDEHGDVQKYVSGNTQQDCCKFTLKHVNAKNIKQKILKIKTSNSIYYKDILNTKFTNILKILREAKKIFIIDLKDERHDIYYTAFEVSF